MKRVRLSSTDARRYQADPGGVAERLVEGAYQGFARARASNFDLASESGSVVEVKSAQSTLANGASGRFRLFKSQHDRLVRKDRRGTAWYVFVVVDVGGGRDLTARLKRLKPSEIGSQIGARGGWYDAGHRSGKEYKLSISAVF